MTYVNHYEHNNKHILIDVNIHIYLSVLYNEQLLSLYTHELNGRII